MFRIILSIILLQGFAGKVAAIHTTADSSIVISLLHEAKQLQRSQPDSAMQLAHEAYRLSQKTGYTKGLGGAFMRMGNIYHDRGEEDTALLYVRNALAIRSSLNDYAGASSACVMLSFICQETGAKDSAFYYLFESLRFCQKGNDSTHLVQAYTQLSTLSGWYGDRKNALSYLVKAQQVANQYGNPSSVFLVCEELGKYWYGEDKYSTALNWFQRADSLARRLDDPVMFSKNLNNIALCYGLLGNYALAKTYYKQALDIYKRLGMQNDIALAYFNLGNMYNNTSQPDSAIYFLYKALPLARATGDLQRVSRCYEFLADAYAMKNDFLRAYDCHVQYTLLKDSLLNEEKIASIAEMQTKYETEKKEQQIVLLDEQGKTRKAQRNFFIAGSIVLLLGLFVLGFYYLQRQKLAKKNEQIARQKIDSLLNEQEIKTYNAMMEGQEEERKRIASDLHDRLGSMLSTVKLLFSSLDTKIDRAQEENSKQYEKANVLLDEAVAEVRRVSHNLSTGMVLSFGLEPALQELCDNINQSRLIQCKLLVYGMDERIDQSVEIGIYRMVQELFNNILKHAQAKQLTVQINRIADSLNVTVEDDGIGFDVAEKRKSGGMGLQNLEKRAAKMNGVYHVDSKPGKGTISIIEIPLINPDHD